MSDDDAAADHGAGALFRDEALAHHVRHSGPGDMMRHGSPWVDRLYWIVLVLVVVGVLVASVVEVDGRSLLEILAGKR